jgi:dipeptidyl-peptidase-4
MKVGRLASAARLLGVAAAVAPACGGAPAGAPCPSSPASPPQAAAPAPPSAVPEALPPVVDRVLLHRYVETRRFANGQPADPALAPDGRTVLFLRSGASDRVQSLFEMDVASGAVREVLAPQTLDAAPERLTQEERARRERAHVATRGFTAFEPSKDGKTVVVSLSGKLYALDRASGRAHLVDVGKGAAIDPHLSPDGRLLAYVQDDDLHVVAVDGRGKPIRLTRGGTTDRTHGLADFVSAEELRRERGFFWSPDSKSLLFEESDTAGVEHLTIADPSRPEATADRMAYPRPGTKNPAVRFGIVRVAAPGAVTWLLWDHARMPYVARVVWSEGAPPSLVVADRAQKDVWMLVADPATGATREAMHEHDDAWVNLASFTLEPGTPRWLPDGSAFLWWSERDGDGRFGLVPANDPAGVRWLTPRGVQAIALRDLDPGRRVAVIETTRDGLHVELDAVPLDGGAPTLLAASGEGVLEPRFGEGHDAYVAYESSLAGEARHVVRSLDGKTSRAIPSVAEAPEVPRVTVEDVGPDRVHVAVVRPHNLVPGARYPVVDSAYGGPAVNYVSLDPRGRLLDQWLADATGAIVVRLDVRGTPGRGRAWERALEGHLGDVPLEGHVAAIQALAAAHPEMDATRVGIVGKSFGGYLAALAALRRPDFFRAAVALAPVADWRDYDTAYTERYLGLPDANAAAYDQASLLVAARAPLPPREATLLVAHGTADDNVYFLHSLRLVDAMTRAGRHVTFEPLIGQTHQIASPEVQEAVWLRAAETLRQALAR